VLIYTVAGLFTSSNNQQPASPLNLPVSSSSGYRPISTGNAGTGDVAIELTPLGFENGIFTVNLAANTHSVELSQFDLSEITTLSYGGKAFAPTSATQMSGHHSSGIIVFNLDEKPDTFRITMQGIPAVEERVFEWA